MKVQNLQSEVKWNVMDMLRVIEWTILNSGRRHDVHQQKTFPSGRNGSVRVDALRQSRQRHPGGGLLRARRQYNTSRSILPSDRRFAVSSCSVGLYEIHTLSFSSFDLTRSFYDLVDLRNYVDPRGQVVSYLLTLILHSSSQVDSWSWHGEIERDDLTSCS